jgi:hypothetical protein
MNHLGEEIILLSMVKKELESSMKAYYSHELLDPLTKDPNICTAWLAEAFQNMGLEVNMNTRKSSRTGNSTSVSSSSSSGANNASGESDKPVSSMPSILKERHHAVVIKAPPITQKEREIARLMSRQALSAYYGSNASSGGQSESTTSANAVDVDTVETVK